LGGYGGENLLLQEVYCFDHLTGADYLFGMPA